MFTFTGIPNVNLLDEIMPEAGAFYVMDRGYVDFQRLFVLTLSSAWGPTATMLGATFERTPWTSKP